MNHKNIVKVSHELNHFRGGYTRLELDFIFAFISTIRDEDEEFREYSLTLEQLEKKLGKRLILRDMEYMFDTLIKKSFKVNNEEELAVYAFFTKISFNKNTKLLKVKFNPDLKPHLIDLYNKVTNKEGRLFAQGDLRYILELRSEYSKRMYMLMCQWKRGVKVVHSVHALRDMLAVPKGYDYANFKRKILLKAEAELIEKSDIYFEFEEVKEGRKVTDILFIVRAKNEVEYSKKPLPKSLEKYKDQMIYHSGRDWKIHYLEVNEDKTIFTLLVDETGSQMQESFPLSTLKNMVKNMQDRPTLF